MTHKSIIDKFNRRFPPDKIKRNIKKKYAVFYRFRIESEFVEDDVIHDWEYIGETIANSEEQAINTVRYYYFGKVRQYYPVDVLGHYESYLDWKAEVI